MGVGEGEVGKEVERVMIERHGGAGRRMTEEGDMRKEAYK